MKRSAGLAVLGGELERALAARIDGEVRFDAGSQAMYAHDASNYRQVPIGVVIPRHGDDVLHALQICRAHDVPVLARGGGTSLAGQCVNHAVVIDFSKYMNRVIEIDPVRRRVRVQPGCILDDMRAALAEHGLTYGPDPSTHSHCTLGGMIGNNSCGVHSVMGEFYGPGARTSDHVESLDVITGDGVQLRVGATPDPDAMVRVGGRIGQIYASLVALRDRHESDLRTGFVHIPRRSSGYNLDELLPERGFHVARALVGTESTCVTIVEAELAVYPARPARALVVLGYPDVYAAGDHIPRIREFRPVGLEGLDERLLDDMRRTQVHARDIKMLPDGKGFLLVEFGADTREEAEAQANRMIEALRHEPHAPTVRLYDDRAEEEKIWKVREAGLGATAFIPGRPDAWEGWEDSAVPPEELGQYLRELRTLFDEFGYDSALYGHFGQGCVHCRINFDFSSKHGIALYRAFTERAAELVVRHGGSLSGEHGDGQSRGDLLVKQYGERLVGAFHEFKRIWDPDGRMNPGKKLGGYARTDNLKLATYHPAPVATTFLLPADHGDFRHAAIRCVGIGNCRRTGGGTMCPSFMATREEKDSTRGRAHMLYEMVEGEVIRDGWASNAVKDALDLCLSCKGCKGDCPVHTDMATYKSEFLSHYYQHHYRPRHAYAFGWIHRWARLASHMPALVNWLTESPGLGRIAAWVAGMAPERAIPRFADHPFHKRFLARRDDRPPVILWPDTFNNYFFPETLEAAALVLDDAGFRVVVPRGDVCCGRPLYDYGMLDLAKRQWRRMLRILEPATARGTPIIGLEPSCVAAFRDELPGLFPHDEGARRLCAQTQTLAGFLRERGYTPPPLRTRAVLHGHCHHKAVLDFGAEQQLLAAMQLELEQPDAGCCGLAGSFGFEREHYEISMAIGERVLLPAIRRERDALLIADGFSCREQISHGTGRQALHVAEVVALALHAAKRAASADRSESPSPDRRRSNTSAPFATTGAPSNKSDSTRT